MELSDDGIEKLEAVGNELPYLDILGIMTDVGFISLTSSFYLGTSSTIQNLRVQTAF